jgi:hypothetical protein
MAEARGRKRERERERERERDKEEEEARAREKMQHRGATRGERSDEMGREGRARCLCF